MYFKHSKYVGNGRKYVAFSVHIGLGSSILILSHPYGSAFSQSFVFCP